MRDHQLRFHALLGLLELRVRSLQVPRARPHHAFQVFLARLHLAHHVLEHAHQGSELVAPDRDVIELLRREAQGIGVHLRRGRGQRSDRLHDAARGECGNDRADGKGRRHNDQAELDVIREQLIQVIALHVEHGGARGDPAAVEDRRGHVEGVIIEIGHGAADAENPHGELRVIARERHVRHAAMAAPGGGHADRLERIGDHPDRLDGLSSRERLQCGVDADDLAGAAGLRRQRADQHRLAVAGADPHVPDGLLPPLRRRRLEGDGEAPSRDQGFHRAAVDAGRLQVQGVRPG